MFDLEESSMSISVDLSSYCVMESLSCVCGRVSVLDSG